MVAIVPVGAIVGRQARIVASFRAAGATTPNQAVTPAALGVDEGLAFRKLRAHTILQDAGDQRIYVDVSRWEALQVRRWRAARICICVALAVLLTVVLWAALR